MRSIANRSAPARSRGFAVLALLIFVGLTGAALAAMGTFYSHAAQREKERELLFVGDQFRQAIAQYYRKSPGAQAYPKTLEELVEDKRNVVPQHWLRRIYADPVTRTTDWGTVEAPGGGIMGVYSKSEETPVKSANFALRDDAFKGKTKYSDWKFVFNGDSPNGLAPGVDKSAPK
jgi:type II secretory pathway pseudopilin PulG